MAGTTRRRSGGERGPPIVSAHLLEGDTATAIQPLRRSPRQDLHVSLLVGNSAARGDDVISQGRSDAAPGGGGCNCGLLDAAAAAMKVRSEGELSATRVEEDESPVMHRTLLGAGSTAAWRDLQGHPSKHLSMSALSSVSSGAVSGVLPVVVGGFPVGSLGLTVPSREVPGGWYTWPDYGHGSGGVNVLGVTHFVVLKRYCHGASLVLRLHPRGLRWEHGQQQLGMRGRLSVSLCLVHCHCLQLSWGVPS